MGATVGSVVVETVGGSVEAGTVACVVVASTDSVARVVVVVVSSSVSSSLHSNSGNAKHAVPDSHPFVCCTIKYQQSVS